MYSGGMEVGFQDHPPFMENTAIVGPTHSPVLDAMATLEERERIEADYEWFRYSKFALPFLVFILLVASTLFCLSAWFGGLSLKHIHPGIPRQYEPIIPNSDDQAGIPIVNRNLRLAAFSFGSFGLLGIALTMYLKPAGSARKGMYFLFAFLGLFVGGILSGIAGALDVSRADDAIWCRTHERGTVYLGDANCYSMAKLQTAVAVVAIAFCFFGIFTCVCLCIAAAKSFKKPSPEELEQGAQPRGVSRTVRECLLLLLFVCFVLLVLLLTFTLILREGRDTQAADDAWNVRQYSNPIVGWPKKNTRLRLAGASIAVLTILLNLIPFRSRVTAYMFAFIYFLDVPVLLAAFAMDVKDVDTAKDFRCPEGFDCEYGPFYATCFFDLLLALLLLFYVISEFIARLLIECKHCNRAFGVFQIQKHEFSECSSRPVRCELCSQKVKAKQFVYQHRFECGNENQPCSHCHTTPTIPLTAHQAVCPQRPVHCRMCERACPRGELAAHLAACPEAPVPCEACGETFRSHSLADHQALCGEALVACELCAQAIPRCRLADHLSHDCQM
eukprot:NODE_861_length_1807_cov_41.648810_g806_i0.p1 GENE.NODE_861_length_1807_cov_41.648810_g806_i0~~NODE_861_length_1807_cov_41.648810_g806_i0.p1  ORF type:complete len:559 (+),score=156.12 NODE_861_length_1807_cov_41.648810_g806_i0:61-1737(+)